MPRRSILLAAERQSLLAISDLKDDLIQHYTLSDIDLSLIQQCRGAHNRLGFAIQLCYMRHPGLVLASDSTPFLPLLQWVADQLKIPVDAWHLYAQRAETRREHLLVLQSTFGFVPFKTQLHHAVAVQQLQALAAQTDKGIVLATALVDLLRRQHILLPTLDVLERICAEAITVANRQIYTTLTHSLSQDHLTQLDGLLVLKTGTNQTWLAWLRQSPVKANSVHMNAHIDRLNVLKRISLPLGIERHTHQNRLLKIAREGGQMKAADLAKFEPQRRYATLVALVIETQATVIDEMIDLHDRIIGKLLAAAKNRHQQQFQSSGKAINDKVRLYEQIGRVLIDAKNSGSDPFAAIEKIISWDDFTASIDEAQQLAQPAGFDFLHRMRDSYPTVRRYSPAFLNTLDLHAAPAAQQTYPALKPLIGGAINLKQIRAHWDEILRLATSIKQGTVTASLMLRKLGSYPRQNGLALALRELGRIERTLFILDWLQNIELRRRVHAGLNKGEARNALARAVFFNRLGEIRDRSFEQQRYRASGLNLVTAAIVLWNTVYVERAVQAMQVSGITIDPEHLQYLSPLGWEHINLTGDYVWKSRGKLAQGKFRPLRPVKTP